MHNKKLTLHSTQSVYQGFFNFTKIQFTHSLYNGKESDVIEREVFSRGQAVVVLLYDLKLQQIVLVEQCRAGAISEAVNQKQTDHAWLLEPVAGMIDLSETPLQAGQREAKEETGVDTTQLEYICQFYPSPGACDEILHLYASDIDSTKINHYAGNPAENEDIRVVVLSFSEAKRRLLNSQFNVASTNMALHWLFFQKLSN